MKHRSILSKQFRLIFVQSICAATYRVLLDRKITGTFIIFRYSFVCASEHFIVIDWMRARQQLIWGNYVEVRYNGSPIWFTSIPKQ